MLVFGRSACERSCPKQDVSVLNAQPGRQGYRPQLMVVMCCWQLRDSQVQDLCAMAGVAGEHAGQNPRLCWMRLRRRHRRCRLAYAVRNHQAEAPVGV